MIRAVKIIRVSLDRWINQSRIDNEAMIGLLNCTAGKCLICMTSVQVRNTPVANSYTHPTWNSEYFHHGIPNNSTCDDTRQTIASTTMIMVTCESMATFICDFIAENIQDTCILANGGEGTVRVYILYCNWQRDQ